MTVCRGPAAAYDAGLRLSEILNLRVEDNISDVPIEPPAHTLRHPRHIRKLLNVWLYSTVFDEFREQNLARVVCGLPRISFATDRTRPNLAALARKLKRSLNRSPKIRMT